MSRFGDQRDIANEVCEPEVTKKILPVWGIDSEGELRSAWRGSGHPQLYFAAGKVPDLLGDRVADSASRKLFHVPLVLPLSCTPYVYPASSYQEKCHLHGLSFT